jgi:hypothetical protein
MTISEIFVQLLVIVQNIIFLYSFSWVIPRCLNYMCLVLVRRPDGKRPLGRPRSRWRSNIKVGLEEVGWGGMDWSAVAQDRDRWRALVNAVMNLRVT